MAIAARVGATRAGAGRVAAARDATVDRSSGVRRAGALTAVLAAAGLRDVRLALAERPALRGDVPFRAVLFFFVVRGAFPRLCFANLFASLRAQPCLWREK